MILNEKGIIGLIYLHHLHLYLSCLPYLRLFLNPSQDHLQLMRQNHCSVPVSLKNAAHFYLCPVSVSVPACPCLKIVPARQIIGFILPVSSLFPLLPVPCFMIIVSTLAHSISHDYCFHPAHPMSQLLFCPAPAL